MHFGNPDALWGLALLAVLFAVGSMAMGRRRLAVRRLGDRVLVKQLFAGSVGRWRMRQFLAGLAAFGLLAFAAARPQYGQIEQRIQSAGVDVMIAIDTSPSMTADDVFPNRLAAAQGALRTLLERFRGNRVGIIAFAGEAFLVCPMTIDHAMAGIILDSIDENTIGLAGTDIGKAIDLAVGSFEKRSSGSRVLVLLTDGEDNEGRGVKAARLAADAGVQILAIGIGTQKGSTLRAPNGEIRSGPSGAKIHSRMNLAGLDKIARETGGLAYAAGEDPTRSVNSIALRIDRIQKSEIEGNKLVIYQDRFEWFLGPAIALLFYILLSRPARLEAVAGMTPEDADVAA